MEGLVAGLIARIREAADAGVALRKALAGSDLGGGPVAVLAFGKASLAMAQVAAEFLGERLSRVMVVTLEAHEAEAREWVGRVTRGGDGGLRSRVGLVEVGDHPLPTARSVAAARGAMEFVGAGVGRGEDELWVLVSGGGSAMMCLPHVGVELDELARLTRAVQESGATIHDLNTVRRHVDRTKGGQLAAAAVARGARVRAFVLSDVIGDAMETIASGPTAADPTTPRDALGVIERLGLRDAAEKGAAAWGSCVAFLERCVREGVRSTVPPGDVRLRGVENRIIASNALVAREAVAYLRECGIEVVRVEERVEGEARQIGERLAREAMAMRDGQAVVVAGEWTVSVGAVGGVGGGPKPVGGPSQELALAAACALDEVEGVMVVAISTDGRDGPTDAAGAVVDGATCARARAAGVEPRDALVRHDSTRALDAAGALIKTGATGTNLNHVAVAVAERKTKSERRK